MFKQIIHFFADYGNQIKTLIYGMFIFLNIDIDLTKILVYLMIIDTVLGALKAIRLRDKDDDFSVASLFWGICSKCLYLIVPFTLALISKGLGYANFVILADIAIKLLIVAEGISIMGNAYTIKTKKKIKNVDFVSMLILTVRKLLIGVFEKLNDNLKNNQNPKPPKRGGSAL